MITIAKRDAIAALQGCGGDVTHAALRAAGLTYHGAVVLGKVLDALDCTIKRGRGGQRVLVVDTDTAIARIRAIHGAVLGEPVPAVVGCVVQHDPHGVYDRGEILALRYVRRLVRMTDRYPDVDGLEVAYDGEVYRLYHLAIYRLVDGEMVEAAL